MTFDECMAALSFFLISSPESSSIEVSQDLFDEYVRGLTPKGTGHVTRKEAWFEGRKLVVTERPKNNVRYSIIHELCQKKN